VAGFLVECVRMCVEPLVEALDVLRATSSIADRVEVELPLRDAETAE
jgi:hypothetical protein